MKKETKVEKGGYLKILLRLLSYFKEYKAYSILSLICIVISASVSVVTASFIRILIDDFISPLLTDLTPSFEKLFNALILLAVIYIAGVITNFIYRRLMITISQGIMKRIRHDLFAHMQRLPLRYFDTKSHGDIMSHYTNDVDTMNMFLSEGLPQMLTSIISIIVVFFAMVTTDIPLTMLVLFGSVAMIFITKKIGTKSVKYFYRQQEALGKLDGYIEEIIHGQKVVSVFNHEEKSIEKFTELNENLFKNSAEANKYSNIMRPIMGNISNILYVLVAIVGGALAISPLDIGLTLGAIASFLQLTKSFTMPIAELSGEVNMIVVAFAGAKRIFTMMDEECEIDNGDVTLIKDEKGWTWKKADGSTISLKGDVRFKNVDFSYDGKRQILHDITLYAKPGQKLAFVGATGAGKTTITNLINRFYDIENGEILYDDINIKNIKKADLRHSLGIVLQDTNLFSGTVADNIRYGRENATDDEIKQAAILANADGFISRLPKGYDTVIDPNGSNLSQGQCQLLSIARAAVANPPVMILDEATSSIDTRTEAIVQQGMDSLMEGRTVFVIAHRLSTVKNSKAIMVLADGRIIERGDHNQLIALNGIYNQLYTGAFELE